MADDPLTRLIHSTGGDVRKAFHHDGDGAGQKGLSPLISEIANRTRPGTPPPTQPLTATGGRGVGRQNVTPSPTVDEIDIPHVHRHSGDKEGIRSYFHAHPHRHSVVHDPDDPNDVTDHDRADHLGDSRHVAAIRGFGGWEAKSFGSSAADALKAVQADSIKVQGYVTNRDISLGMINERLKANGEAIRLLKMSAELAELRKSARPTHTKRAAASTVPLLVKHTNAEAAKRRTMAEIAKRQAPALKLADELVALYPLLEHPDFSIRKGAQELRAQKLAELQNLGRPDVTKASGGFDDEPI